MDLREVLHNLIDHGGRWDDADGHRGADAHEAVERYFTRPDPPATPGPDDRPAPPATRLYTAP